MKIKTLFKICLMLLGVKALQAQELKPFKDANGKYGYKDESGKVVIEPNYDGARRFIDDLAVVNIRTEHKTQKRGAINKNGKKSIPLAYYSFSDFSEGLARVQKFSDKGLGGTEYGYINKSGEEIISFTYANAGNFKEGLAGVMVGGKWGYIDKKGREVIKNQYSSALGFSEGLGGVKSFQNLKWNYINAKGELIIHADFDDASSFSEGLAAVKSNEKWGYIDKKGKLMIPFEYDFLMDIPNNFKNGKVQVKKDGRTFFIDNTGKEVK